jgi:hypothetical protein
MSFISNDFYSNESETEDKKEIKVRDVFSGLPPLGHCTYCYEDMGLQNLRQYCRKSHCFYFSWEPFDILIIRKNNLKDILLSSCPRYSEDDKKRVKKLICYMDSLE